MCNRLDFEDLYLQGRNRGASLDGFLRCLDGVLST
jgi:hypothetical protein